MTPKGGVRLWAAAIALLAASRSSIAHADEPPAKEEPPRTQDEDVVETLDDDAVPAAPVRITPETRARTKDEKIELRGFARTTFQLGVPADGPAPRTAGTDERVGYERYLSVNQAYLDARYTSGKTFQAVLSGSIAYTAALVEGAAGRAIDDRDLRSVLVEPMLREAYIGIYTSRVDIRLGQQRIVWGNSDAITPNDVLNARDQRNRMQLDPEMLNIPTLAARADFDLGVAVLGIVAQPFFVPDRTSIYGGNWSLVQPDAPLHVRRLFGAHARDSDPQSAEAELARAKALTDAFDGASIGTSLRMHFGNLDTSFYYHYGRDRSPYVYVDPDVANQLANAKNPGDYLQIYGEQQKASQAYGGPFVVESIRRHHVGMDMATTAGPFVLRMDAAFDTAMTFYTRENLNSVARPTAQVVAGVEYQRGAGNVVVLEGTYMRLLGPALTIVPTANQANFGPLLFVDEDNAGVANLVRWMPFENVVFEMRSFLGIVPLSWVVRPEIGWASSSFTLRAGYLAIDGTAGSFGGYFRRNETAYVTFRYSF